MKNLNLASLVLLTLASCSGIPKAPEIDSALLAYASESARNTVAEARAERDRAEDAHALARREREQAEGAVKLARAAVSSARSKLDESKLAVEVAEASTVADLESARAMHAALLIETDVTRETLALRKRQAELARLEERLALERFRRSRAIVELRKAESLEGVDMAAAQGIPLQDYRKQVAYLDAEVETARDRVRAARARVDEAEAAVKAARAGR